MLIEKEPPPRPGDRPPSLTELDRRILTALSEGRLCRTGEIAQELGAKAYRVSARLRLMADRHFVAKVPVKNGPKRGPGAFTYHLIEGESGTVTPASWSSTHS